MKKIILIGSGGCMREILWQIEELNKKTPTYKIQGYVDCKRSDKKGIIERYDYLGDDEYLLNKKEDTNVIISVGESKLRQKLYIKYKKNPFLKFAIIIMDDVKVSDTAQIEEASIICTGSIITTDVKIGKGVFVNTNSLICHDDILRDFVTILPGTYIARNVK